MKTILDIIPENLVQWTSPGVPSDNTDHIFQARVAEAYAALFSGQGSSDDASLVLIDLAQFVRYYDTAPLTTPAEVVKALEQRRAVFNRVLEAIAKAGIKLDDLHGAVLRSPAVGLPEEGL